MESDIVERLRDLAEINESDPAMLPSESKILREAAVDIDRLRSELAAAIKQRDEATAWIPCADLLPPPGQPVLVAVESTVLRAMHAPHLTLSEDDYGDFQPLGEYDEKTDRTYWPEGWYECNAFEETHWRVERDPTHWMPLPKPPQQKEGGVA